ncbi:Hypp7383 [Branchiostoma lanceolatum]|uniref:Hypp7383 protein n=1 Tax=Branchiostoma lanceolatum TaxID=7740 RepID=A0A8J9Z060_BRALA|nr:Hypp7383 [Branchiostoma lanceolatum]
MEVSYTKESPEKEPDQEDRMYEDVDPHGESITGPSSGLQGVVPNLPKHRSHEGIGVSDVKQSPEKEPDQEDRMYEDIDPHGESITGPSSGLQRAVPNLPPPRRHEGVEVSETKQLPEKEPEQEHRMYEDVDGDANVMLGRGLQCAVPSETSHPHLDMGDHVVCPELNQDTFHDTSYTQEDIDRNEEPETPNVNNEVGGRKTEGGPVASPDSQDDPDTSDIHNVDRDGIINNQRQQPVDAGTDDSATQTANCNTPGLATVSASNLGLVDNMMYAPCALRQAPRTPPKDKRPLKTGRSRALSGGQMPCQARSGSWHATPISTTGRKWEGGGGGTGGQRDALH